MKPHTTASPHAIIMVGIPGSGKSAFAERFADTFQAPILNRLKLQKDLELDNEQADKLADIMLAEFLKTRRTLVLEGGLDTKDARIETVKQLHKAGYRSLLVWVQTDTTESKRRASKPYPQGSGISEDDFDAILDHFEAPSEKEKYVVISGKHTYTTQLKIILKQLASDTGASKPPKPPITPPRGRGIIIR
jgi:adenylylsulfate kinase-like enzyme